ncbi:PAAR domain-containing protein [Cupriavidus sp. PET2-C1]
MNLPIITVGDTTTHGGRVITGSASHLLQGRPIARQGDLVDCPAHYSDGRPHGVNAITEGDPAFLVEGRPVALHGHRCECGCELIGSQLAAVGG